ncbi:hypothetical protein DICVIV_07876 [Dictyocaulus viviparus]|uniref:7TM GPCR serpentine receptor class x (Srx) domain-containing protein n=1 Tax=Dictyocaulus viviparus TaxID=29172 RepID=A0A0D8XUK4_DICVI|nr:hypothetical protein DICVIV_07876 [Dictyocaulus viviparus]
MVLGMIVIVLTIIILIRLRIVHQQPQVQQGVWMDSNKTKLKQANRTCAGILLISLICVTLPSVGVGFLEMINISIFRSIGPFYIVGLLSAGLFFTYVFF